MAGYSTVLVRIGLKFKLIQAFMFVLITNKNEEDPSKMKEIELVRDIIIVLAICKFKEDPIKNEGARVLTRFSLL